METFKSRLLGTTRGAVGDPVRPRYNRAMFRLHTFVLGSACVMSAGGCDAILGFLQPSVVTVRMVNNSDFAVQVRLIYDDDQELPRDILEETGTALEFTISAGDTTTISRSCNDLQAVFVDNADLLIIGEIGPEADTDVLRDGDDFSCGDTIVFTFDHSEVLLDFDVVVEVQGDSP